MGTDVFLEIIDHLFSMLKILDGEKDGHREGEEADQAEYDLKSETLVKLNLSHLKYQTPQITLHGFTKRSGWSIKPERSLF